VAIRAGNDRLSGDAGNDYLLGDSLALAVAYQADHPATPVLTADPETLRGYLWRENYELTAHYLRSGGGSQISNDLLLGGDGNDCLYGQHRDDRSYGEAGDDLVYGGDGEVDVVDGGSGTNDVRVRGDDWPKLERLAGLQGLVFQTVAAVLPNELRHAASQPVPVTVSIDQAVGQADAAQTNPVHFTVAFSAPVADFTAADVQLSGTALDAAVQKIVPIGADGTTYDVVVGGMTGPGTIVATILAGAAHDAAGRASLTATSWDNQVTFKPFQLQADFGTSGSAVVGQASLSPVAWQPSDVNRDGRITPLDALLSIGFLDMHGDGTATSSVAGGSAYDVNRDGCCSARDTVLVVKALNALAQASEGSHRVPAPSAAELAAAHDAILAMGDLSTDRWTSLVQSADEILAASDMDDELLEALVRSKCSVKAD
jgi:Ca2+-binding RTX toxin-like protein